MHRTTITAPTSSRRHRSAGVAVGLAVVGLVMTACSAGRAQEPRPTTSAHVQAQGEGASRRSRKWREPGRWSTT